MRQRHFPFCVMLIQFANTQLPSVLLRRSSLTQGGDYRRLCSKKTSEGSWSRQQFLKGSCFDDGSCVQHNDTICETDSAEAMSNNAHSHLSGEPIKCLVDHLFRETVEGVGCLVQNENFGATQQ